MQWEQFNSVYAQIGPPLAAAQNALTASLMEWVRPWLQGGVLLYLVGRLLWGAMKPEGDPFSKAEEVLITGMVAITFATSMAWFGPYVRDLVMVEWIQGIGARIAGTTSATTLNAAMFDEAWNRAWVAGLAFYRGIPWSMAGLGLLAILLMFWFSAAAAIVLGFVVWLKATTFATFLLGIGPLFVGLFAFPWTRRWFWGFVNTLVANVVLSVLAFGLVALMLTANIRILSTLLTQVQASAAASGWFQSAGNEFAQAKILLGAFIINIALGWIALQLPGTAASITHGFSGYGHFATGLAGFLGGSRSADAGGGGEKGGRDTGGTGGASSTPPAPAPAATPPGPSLSNPPAAKPAAPTP